MTEGRPPKEGASNSEPESEEDAQLGRRSQTRSVAGRAAGSNAAPRATFSPAPGGPPKPAPGSKQASPPRSVFQQTPSGQPPTSSDPDKTVKRPYPTAPGTWGQTLPLGDLLPGQESALFPSEEAETTVQVARSAFVKTLISGEGLSPPTLPPSVAQPRPASDRPPPARVSHSHPPDEPLTVPSNRPAPTPWQQSRAAAPTGTMLMPGSPGARDDAAASQRNAGATSQARPAGQASPASQARGVHASAKQTLPMGSAAITAEAAGVPAASAAELPASTRTAKPASAAAPRANAAAAPASAPSARAPRSAAPARPESIGSGTAPALRGGASFDRKSASEPLQLRIEERDVLQQPQMSERPVLPRNRGPLVAALLIATLVVLGAIAWFGLAKPAAPVAEPTRNDAVTVPAGQQPGAPTPTTAELAQPVAPTAPQPAGTAQPAAQPAQPPNSPQTQQAAQPAVVPAQARESQTAAPAQPKSQRESAASRRRAERRAARRQAAEDQQAAPAADVPEDVQEARDALRALESDPVIKIKPAPSEEPEEPDFPSLPEPPEPPPPPDSE
jgi:hypothetical protein